MTHYVTLTSDLITDLMLNAIRAAFALSLDFLVCNLQFLSYKPGRRRTASYDVVPYTVSCDQFSDCSVCTTLTMFTVTKDFNRLLSGMPSYSCLIHHVHSFVKSQ